MGIKAIICLDDNNGILFNRRRQSKDREVRRRMLKIVGNDILYMSAYSYRQFTEGFDRLAVSDKLVDGGFYFFETDDIPYDDIDTLYVFRWNRRYPIDRVVDMGYFLNRFRLAGVEEFKGNSHDRIVLGVYERL